MRILCKVGRSKYKEFKNFKVCKCCVGMEDGMFIPRINYLTLDIPRSHK